MSVDLNLTKKILVVHGVQTGTDADQTQNVDLNASLSKFLVGIDYSTDIFTYEDINDQAQAIYKRIVSALSGNPITGMVASVAIDLAGDVLIALREGSVYDEIIGKLRAKIMASFEKGEPLFIVAHSLGTIYAFDAVNQIMKDRDLFLYNRKNTWPIQGLVTLGSPISLDLFERDFSKMASLIPEGEEVDDDNTQLFPWQNYWDPTDPVVSGSVAGLPWSEQSFKKRFADEKTYPLGWDVMPRSVITGKAHISAHMAYWDDAFVLGGIAQMLRRG
ncbi:hypothetical protein [Colwellia sp. TT2012]|uniref:hypothetical protein n=1 Tax=Colwellia sp. TT2012 TaxID=1720342 RepID=UPI00070F14A7|nr:hypothetical protein [Colwellia sp. TT2012]